MDTTCLSSLINSISRFIHLVSCQTPKTTPIYKNFKAMANVLKLMLDEVMNISIPLNEIFYRDCEDLDVAVNEAIEFIENWSPKMSKICSVLRSESLLINIQSNSVEICRLISKMQLNSSIHTSVQCCMQKIQFSKQDRLAEHIDEALRSERDEMVPCSDHLLKIFESLGLKSNQELLKETVALEKEKLNVETSTMEGDMDQIDQILDLVTHIRNCLIKRDHYAVTNNLPIPPHFCCPLSSELMLDPVILSSGQTYDRASIQKWLDSGLKICPRTRQMLSHTDLISNHSVKSMIANWCKANNIRISSNSKKIYPVADSSPTYPMPSHGLLRTDSFHGSNSTSRSSFEVGNGQENEKGDVSQTKSHDEVNRCQDGVRKKCDHQSLGQSYAHSRSESASSVVSSNEYAPTPNEVTRISNKSEHASECSGEITSQCTSNHMFNMGEASSPYLTGDQFGSSKTMIEVTGNGNSRRNSPQLYSRHSVNLTTVSHVQQLVQALKSQSYEVQASAAAELRHLAKDSMDNRITIGQCGAIVPLLSLMCSAVKLIQEDAVTALLNLSLYDKNKATIAETGAIEPLIHVLKSGNDGAKENAAASLFSLSLIGDFKAKIGRSGAVKALVELLGSGTLRGKKDAATALFNLSIFHENKARIVQAGAVKYLVGLMDPASEMVDKAVALLANLSTIQEGQLAIAREEGIPLLAEIVESGSQRGKENAASVLLQLCLHSPKLCTVVLQEGVVPPLVALSQLGTTRAKEKAQQLLNHFRNHREGPRGRDNLNRGTQF